MVSDPSLILEVSCFSRMHVRLSRGHVPKTITSYMVFDVSLAVRLTPGFVLWQDALAQVEAENAEKAALDTGKTYDRQIP